MLPTYAILYENKTSMVTTVMGSRVYTPWFVYFYGFVNHEKPCDWFNCKMVSYNLTMYIIINRSNPCHACDYGLVYTHN